MQESKSEMSILDEDAKFIDTPTRNPHPPLPSKLKHHYGFSGCFLYGFFFFFLGSPLPSTQKVAAQALGV